MNWIKRAIADLQKIDLNNPQELDVAYMDRVWRAAYYQKVDWPKRRKRQAQRIKKYRRQVESTAEYRVLCKVLKIKGRDVARSLGYSVDIVSRAFGMGFCSPRIELAISQWIQRKLKITDVLPADLNKKLKDRDELD